MFYSVTLTVFASYSGHIYVMGNYETYRKNKIPGKSVCYYSLTNIEFSHRLCMIHTPKRKLSIILMCISLIPREV